MATPEDRIPDGYRQSITTAITVFLGFSITFLRTFQGVGGQGGWTLAERATDVVTTVGILLQLVSLFRALDVLDNTPDRYQRTRWIFIAGVAVVTIGALAALLER